MLNLSKIIGNKILKIKVDQTYNQKFTKARANLEIVKEDGHFIPSTKEMLDMKKN